MQVGEEHVALGDLPSLVALRLLDLDDQLRVFPWIADARAGLLVVGVGRADAGAGIGLDDDLMAGSHHLAHRSGRQAHTVLMSLYFPRNADDHAARIMSEAIGAKCGRLDEWPLAAHHLGDHAARDGPERQAVMRVAESEPQPFMPRRGTDHRHHVRRARPRAHPRVAVEPFGEREELARDGLGAVELYRRLHAVAPRELGARGETD